MRTYFFSVLEHDSKTLLEAKTAKVSNNYEVM